MYLTDVWFVRSPSSKSGLGNMVSSIAPYVALSLVVFLFSKLVQGFILIPRFTILNDLKRLGVAKNKGKIPGRAVICGGSIAGLLAAAVCADHFESVLIVEPEACTNDGRGTELPVHIERRIGELGVPVAVSDRKRVMQWHGTQILHPVSYMALQRLFRDDLQAELRYFHTRPTVAQWRIAPLWEPYREASNSDKTSDAPLTLPLSRPGYENLLRRLVKKTRPNVEFIMGTVVGVRKDESEDQSGLDTPLDRVVIRSPNMRTLSNGSMEEVLAKLVVDATGPTQAGFTKWLKAAGYDDNLFSISNTQLRDEYKTSTQILCVIFTVPPHLHAKFPVPWGFKPGPIIIHGPDPLLGDTRSIWAQITEGNRLLFGMSGPGWTARPHSASELVATLRDYADFRHGRIPPWTLDLLLFFEAHEAECEPFYRDLAYPPLSWIRYHNAPPGSLPRNFVAIGDASVRLNPVGAQGCTNAMYGAVTLDSCLRNLRAGAQKLPEDFSTEFFERMAPRIWHMWVGQKDRDYTAPGVVPVIGETIQTGRLRRWFYRQASKLAKQDREVFSSMWHSSMLLAPPTDVFAPWVLLRMAKQWFIS
ncbi:hypothetical protein FRB95_011362 [Tulasnella sp. JGI-2019a]|nr:hypothetical protein FRB95_011362 [Tulasnella sp. JGI-2019a]